MAHAPWREQAESGAFRPAWRLGLALALAVVALPAALAPVGAARPADAQAYVTVVDSEGRPVTGLSAEDFAMRDGAVRQPLVDAEPATAPLAVVVVLDGFDAADRADVTTALAAARGALVAADPAHRLSLPVAEADPSAAPALDTLPADRERLAAAVGRVITPVDGVGTRRAFVDRLLDACRALRSAPTDRRIILAIARRHAGDGAVADPARLGDALLVGKVALWTIEVGPAQKTPLDKLLGDTADLGGALRAVVPATSALPEAATRVASLFLSQYLLTYSWPNPMLSQVSIAIRHDRGVVLAPIWTR